MSYQDQITFEKVTTDHKQMIFSWLAEPHVQEFWDNTQAHKDDILNFIGGVKNHQIIAMAKWYIL